MLEWARAAAERLAGLDGSDERIAELRAERVALRSTLARDAAELTGCAARRASGSSTR